MDTAYLHIVLNHLPIMGVPFGLGLILLGVVTKNDSIKRAALLTFVILGVLTIPVYVTGKGGEDFVEHLAGVSEETIEAHERMASFALVSVGVLALFSLYAFLKYQGLALFKRRVRDETGLLGGEVSAHTFSAVPGWAVLTALVLALVTSGVLGYTGKLGGKIRHTEFYGGVQNNEDEEANEETNEEIEAEDKQGRGRNRGGRRR